MRAENMKLFAVFASAAAMIAAPAFAASEWTNDLSAPVSGPVRVDEVRLGDHLAENIHQIGQRDLDRLLDELRSDVERRLADRGLLAAPGDSAAAGLTLIMTEARPNRPTFEQLGGRGDWNWDRPNRSGRPTSSQLSLASFGIGGVGLTGEFRAPDGASLGSVTYRYEETDIYQAQFAATWTDAHRGIDLFSRRLAGAIGQ